MTKNMYFCCVQNPFIMKQKRDRAFFKAVLGMLFIIGVPIVHSCQKVETPLQPSADYLIHYPTGCKEFNNSYLLSTHVGHDGKNCPGCIIDKGMLIHKDCVGYGHYCRALAQVILSADGTDITATTTDTFGLTSEDFFLMPDRSLNYTDENNNRIYLNIPEQLVFRDAVTQQFTFTGLFFSNTAAYSNN